MRVQRYGLVAVCLALAACGGSHAPTDLKVTGSPTGEITDKLTIKVAFSRPMVAAAQVGKAAAPPPLEIAPALPGDATWTDDKTLQLAPTASLPRSTRYTVTVPAGTRALDGNELAEASSFSFFTERLTLGFSVLGDERHATADQAVRLYFNQEVPLAQVLEHCHLTAGGKTVPLKNGPESPSGPAREYVIAPSAALALDTDWTLTCDTELRGTVGNIGLEKPVVQALRTFGPLRFVRVGQAGRDDVDDAGSGSGSGAGAGSAVRDIVPDEGLALAIQFTNPLAEPYQMTLSPPVQGFPQQCHDLDYAHPGLRCGVMLDAQTTYTLTIAGTQADSFGQTLGAPQVITFHTTDAKPSVSLETGYFVAELKRPVLPVWTRNVAALSVTAVPITQENFHELQPLLAWGDPKAADFSKAKLAPKRQTISVAGTKNKWAQHPLGAAELFGGVAGPGMFYLELGAKDVDSDMLRDDGREKVLVNFTDIGVVSKLSGARGLVWATRLSTGKPLPGATVTVRDEGGAVRWTGTTDADGLAYLPATDALVGPPPKGGANPDGLDPNGEHYAQERGGAGAGTVDGLRIFVAAGADWTMVNPSRANGLSAWNFNVPFDSQSAGQQLRGFMHTDRGLYRPGETVHVKGLARVTRLGSPLDVPAHGKPVQVTVSGPQGKAMFHTTATLSPFGGFWFDLDLPGDARLGDYSVDATLEGGAFNRTFTVEEYRPATFEAASGSQTASVVRQGTVAGSVSATYFYGAPVRGAAVDVTVHSRARHVEFTGYEDYSFGDDRTFGGYAGEAITAQSLVTESHVTLDGKGAATFSVPVSPNDVAHDADLLIATSVHSQSGEVESTSFTVPYFAARTYYGVKRPGAFLELGKPWPFQVVAVGADGKPVHGPAKVTISRHDWNCVWEDWGYRGNYQCKDSSTPVLTQVLQLDGKPAEFSFSPAAGGQYFAVIEGTSEKQQAAPTSVELYAYGDGGGSWQSSDTMTLDIVADKQTYQAGDVATLLLKTDLTDATGLVTIERDGVLEKRLVAITPKVKHLQVPISAAYAPNVYVSVALVQGRIGDGSRGKPRMRMGIVNLSVRPADNKLTVAVDTDKTDYRPGDPVTATVKVTDAAGQPVSAEVSITASDEGVLSLMGYQTPNPIPTFYAPWGLGVTTATQLEYIRDIPGANQDRPAFGGDAVGTARSNFISTAVWAPGAVTDGSGTATVKFVAPDGLTAFRVMALAADKGHRFGSGDHRFKVNKPLQLHAALPRFLEEGDTMHAGVVVHNETGRAGTATVKLVLDGHLTATGGLERTVPLPKDTNVPVFFDLTGAKLGTGKLTFSVTMDQDTDAIALTLPIEHPSPLRTAAIADGIATAEVTVPVALPPHTLPGSAELVVSADPDGLAGIEEGLRDLVHYPYGCLEQTTSQVIPMIAARELAETLAIDGLTGADLNRFVRAGLTKIGRHQTAYGGFSLWPNEDPDPYYTAYALWGLYLAKQAGYAIDDARVEDGLAYLKNDGQTPDSSRPHYSDHGNRGTQAFALYVRTLWGDKSALAAVTTLGADPTQLPIYGKAFAARALAAGLGAKDPTVVQRVAELAALADAATKTDALIEEPQQRYLWSYMSSAQRTTAIVLAAIVEIDPKNAALPGLVRVVMKHRRDAGYGSTQDDLYALLALTSYARTVSAVPASVAVTFGGAPLLSGALAGKQRIRAATVPLTGPGPLVLTPTGEVHYHVAIHYRQTVDALVAESHGVTLAAEYLDEGGRPQTSFAVGDVVRVRVTAAQKDDLDHLMVSVPLPAGFEAINTRFVQQGAPGIETTTEWGSYSEIHDDRVDFASEYTGSGTVTHEFLIRAMTAGTFVRPPTVAELMYRPGLGARTAAQTVTVRSP